MSGLVMSDFHGRGEAEGLMGDQYAQRRRVQGPAPRGAVDEALSDLDGKIGELHARIEALRNAAAPAAQAEAQAPPAGTYAPASDPQTAYEQTPSAPTG